MIALESTSWLVGAFWLSVILDLWLYWGYRRWRMRRAQGTEHRDRHMECNGKRPSSSQRMFPAISLRSSGYEVPDKEVYSCVSGLKQGC